MPELRELTTDEAWERAIPILRQLWSHREESFVRSWHEDDDYRLFGWIETGSDSADRGDLIAVAGVYVQVVIHHERGCWVHDLVVDEAHRDQGHGEALLAALEAWAEDRVRPRRAGLCRRQRRGRCVLRGHRDGDVRHGLRDGAVGVPGGGVGVACSATPRLVLCRRWSHGVA